MEPLKEPTKEPTRERINEPAHPAATPPPPPHVPEELLKQLHDATCNFQKDKGRLEAEMDSSEEDRGRHVGAAREQLRESERALEKISAQIHDSLNPPAP